MSDLPVMSLADLVSVAAAWLCAGGGWLVFWALCPAVQDKRADTASDRPFFDLGLSVLALAGIVLFRDVYEKGFLFSGGQIGWIRSIARMLDTLMIYSPVLAVLGVQQQGLGTALFSAKGLAWKLLAGIVLGLMAVLVLLGLRGQVDRLPELVQSAAAAGRIEGLLTLALGAMTTGFVLVRLRWACGRVAAALIVALALGLLSIRLQWQVGREPFEIAAQSMLLTVGTGLLGYLVLLSQDIVWATLVYYLLDVALRSP